MTRNREVAHLGSFIDVSNTAVGILTSVGIGTTNPVEELHLYNSQNSGTVVRIENTNTGIAANASLRTFADVANVNLNVYTSTRTTTGYGIAQPSFGELSLITGNGFQIGTKVSSPLILGTNNTEALRINSSGNVGIGTTNPEPILHVANSTATRQDGGLARFLAPSMNAGADNSIAFGKQFITGTTTWQAALLGYYYDGVNSSSSNSRIYLNVAGRSNTLVVHTNENVGIGVSIPQQRLDVIAGGNIAIGGNVVVKPTGSILQVVHAEFTTSTSLTSSSLTDVSGFNATITPTSTSNKILVMVHFTGVLDCDGKLALKVGGSVVKDNLLGSDRGANAPGTDGIHNYFDAATYCATYLHSPASTSSLTYQIQAAAAGCGNNIYINRDPSGSTSNGRSGITLMEVVA